MANLPEKDSNTLSNSKPQNLTDSVCWRFILPKRGIYVENYPIREKLSCWATWIRQRM